jgi:DNA-binding response OmpR family regulator
MEGNVVEIASDYVKAQQKIAVYDYDCILVDITLPHGSGLGLIKEIKLNKSKAGIIIISAKNSLDDKINGLDRGADDCLPKPFHLSKLNSRVKALIRRKSFDGNLEIIVNEIKILPTERSTFVNDTNVILTDKEYNSASIYF